MSKKAKLTEKIKNSTAILMPLIFSSLERIETVSSAMELRAFGNKKKRTWYSQRDFKRNDYIAMSILIILFIVSIFISLRNGSRFYNPFS